MSKRNLIFSFLILALSQTSFAEGEKKIDAQTNTKATRVENVETLLDKKAELDGKKVTVKGEVKRTIDGQSFILEGGGFLDDEVVAVTQDQEKMKLIRENARVTVTGTLRTIPVVEVRRELSWDLDPQIETELQGARAVLVVDNVSR